MGRVAKVFEVTRSTEDGPAYELKVDDGAGGTTTVPLYMPAGEDATPVVGDFVALVDSDDSSGGEMAVGCSDGHNGLEAEDGARRIYSRDASGRVVATIWLHASGRVEVTGPGALPPVGVSRSDLVDARFAALESALLALQTLFNAHVHTSAVAGSPTSTPPTLSVPPVSMGQPTASQVLISE